MERARAVRPDVPDDPRPVGEIARRLDGLPLAIELAAARVVTLSPADIAARLDDRFRILAGGRRAHQPRHRTLRAMVDWSHELLSPTQQVLFRRLGVFAGDLSLDGASAVASGDQLDRDAILDCLDALVRQSLVVADLDGSETWYRCSRRCATTPSSAWPRRARSTRRRDATPSGTRNASATTGACGHPMKRCGWRGQAASSTTSAPLSGSRSTTAMPTWPYGSSAPCTGSRTSIDTNSPTGRTSARRSGSRHTPPGRARAPGHRPPGVGERRPRHRRGGRRASAALRSGRGRLGVGDSHPGCDPFPSGTTR